MGDKSSQSQSNDSINIGTRINIMRMMRGYTIRDLSINTGIKEPAISAIEHGKKGIGLRSLITIADALNCSLDYLTGRSEELFMVSSQSSCRTQSASDSSASKDPKENRSDEKREQFLAEIGELFDKYISSDSSVEIQKEQRGMSGEQIKSPESQSRAAAVEALKNAIKAGEWKAALWNCIKLYQNQPFKTLGRGKAHTGSTVFTYQLKVSSRTGLETDELIISTRAAGKTVTRSSVELALERFLAVQEEKGYVKGPKSAGQIFGASYQYGMFIKWGVIKSAPSFSD